MWMNEYITYMKPLSEETVFMRMQKHSEIHFDSFIDVERKYFENEADRRITEKVSNEKETVDQLKKVFVNQCIERAHKPSTETMIEELQKTNNFLQDETISKHYYVKNKYLIRKDAKINIINTVEDAIAFFSTSALSELDDEKERSYFFRGHENLNFQAIPSIMRSEKYYKNENDLYSELQTVSSKNFSNLKNYLEILTEMQHFSLPTRLLDISSNILSALFFSTTITDQNSQYVDGEVLVFSAQKKGIKKFSSDTVEIQNSLAFLPYDLKKEIHACANKIYELDKKQRVDKFKELNCVKKLMHEARKSGVFFSDVLDPNDLFEFNICLPLKNNDRIMNQSGAFISYGFTNKSTFHKKIEKEQSGYLQRLNRKFAYKVNKELVRYIVPCSSKAKIRKQLEEMGINQGNIYPDIEKRAAYIKEKFR